MRVVRGIKDRAQAVNREEAVLKHYSVPSHLPGVGICRAQGVVYRAADIEGMIMGEVLAGYDNHVYV
jgi:hypothetical protein